MATTAVTTTKLANKKILLPGPPFDSENSTESKSTAAKSATVAPAIVYRPTIVGLARFFEHGHDETKRGRAERHGEQQRI
jgi:hypothetical protein